MFESKIDPNDIEIYIKGERVSWNLAVTLKDMLLHTDFSIKRIDTPDKKTTKLRINHDN